MLPCRYAPSLPHPSPYLASCYLNFRFKCCAELWGPVPIAALESEIPARNTVCLATPNNNLCGIETSRSCSLTRSRTNILAPARLRRSQLRDGAAIFNKVRA